ncbi:MAG: geranylgeranylglycerol-phosphate geranylgeranyltransferase [Bacteroidales bacterium]
MLTHTSGKKMNYFRIIRWPNLLIMAVLMAGLRYILILPRLEMAGLFIQDNLINFILLVYSVLAIAAGGYVINDILDLEIDSINKPEDQIIGKKISLISARKFYLFLTLSGIFTGIALSVLLGSAYLGVFFPAMAALLFYYSKRYKGRLITGNLVVAFASAMVLIITWNAEFSFLKKADIAILESLGTIRMISSFVFIYALIAFLLSLVREIVKDMEDIDGDEKEGCATIPIVFGMNLARNIAFGLIIFVMLVIGWWQFSLYGKAMNHMANSLFISQIVACVTLFLLTNANNKISLHKVSLFLKIWMISGMASMLFLNFR